MKTTTITAIDIGTSSIKLLVGEKTAGSSAINILAKEQIFHSIGVRKGEIYNPKKVAENLLKLKQKVQKTQNIRIKNTVLGINGVHLSSLKTQGLVSVSRADRKISEEDIRRAIQACQAIHLPANKEILEALPLEFVVDGESGIKNPLGLEGVRLEVKALLACVFSPAAENLETAVSEAGFEIEEVIPSILASARAVLTSEQKELGAAVIDIGAGTTSLALFSEGNVQDFVVFPMGSANITNDIAIGLRQDIATAEKIKKEFGSFQLRPAAKKGLKKGDIKIPEKGISFSESFLRNIIRQRVLELFSEASKVLKKSSREMSLPGGISLTGGGACLPGLIEFAREKFELPTYLSGPKEVNGVTEPAFSVCAGLLLLGFEEKEDKESGGIRGDLKEKIKRIFKVFLP